MGAVDRPRSPAVTALLTGGPGWSGLLMPAATPRAECLMHFPNNVSTFSTVPRWYVPGPPRT